jgi:hypothetical protein
MWSKKWGTLCWGVVNRAWRFAGCADEREAVLPRLERVRMRCNPTASVSPSSADGHCNPCSPRQPSLTPEAELPAQLALTRSLLKPQHLCGLALAMREAATEKGGRLFFFSHNLHFPGGNTKFALQTACESVSALAFAAWRLNPLARGSFLSPAATGQRPLAVLVPERDGYDCWHVHGFMFLPPSISQRTNGLLKALRQVPRAEVLRNGRELKKSAVNLEFIHSAADLMPFVDYAAKSWFAMPPSDRLVEFAPHGSSLRTDWAPIMGRADQLMQNYELQRQHIEHDRAERTRELLQKGCADRHARAKSLTGKDCKGRGCGKPTRQVRQAAKPSKLPQLPSTRAKSGEANW